MNCPKGNPRAKAMMHSIAAERMEGALWFVSKRAQRLDRVVLGEQNLAATRVHIKADEHAGPAPDSACTQ